MKLPECPNYRDRTCERSSIKLLGEHDSAWLFMCSTCNLFWAVSKDRAKERGRYEAAIARVERASEIERERARKRVYSYRRH